MTAAGRTFRVWVPEVWDVVTLEPGADWTVAQLKSEALAAALGRAPEPALYEVKYRGGPVDDSVALDSLNAPGGAGFIVLRSQRQPVR